MIDMADWRERAKRLADKPAAEPAIDKAALAKRANELTAASAAMLEKQKEFSHRIATAAVSSVITELAKVLGGETTRPTIEEHHKRMLGVTAEIKGQPVVVNILSLPSGKIRLSCFIGVDGDGREQEFGLDATSVVVSTWLGEQLVGYFERAD